MTLWVVLSVWAIACSPERSSNFAASSHELSVEKPIYIERAAKAVWLLGLVQAHAFNALEREPAQYHAIVWSGGRARENALFLSYATDVHVHQALVEVGAKPGNNLTLESWDERLAPEHPAPTLRAEGSPIEISVRWEGAKKGYPLSEILEDAGGRGFDFRFGGNLAYVKKWKSGCVACLYSCPGGKVSNASYTIRDFVNGATQFHAREDRLPPDGTEVVLILKVKSD